RGDVGRAAEGRRAGERARPERDLLGLDPVLGAREEAVAGPVVVVQVTDERHRDVGRPHAHPLDHGGRAHAVADLARARVVLEKARVHQHRMRPAQDEPDEVVQRQRIVLGLAVEELAGRGVTLAVLEGVDLVHGRHLAGAEVYDKIATLTRFASGAGRVADRPRTTPLWGSGWPKAG